MVQGPFGHLAQVPVSGDLKGVQVDPREQRVVVQHLLEVWHQPAGVHRVSMETTPQLVVHAPAGHLAERVSDHAQGVVVSGSGMESQNQLEGHGLRELGRASESAVRRVESRGEVAIGVFDEIGALELLSVASHRSFARLCRTAQEDALKLACVLGHFVAAFSVCVLDCAEDLPERR